MALVVVAVLVYFTVTFVQVFAASRRDGAREADAIVVFGAAQYDGEPSPVLKARLDHVVDLWERDLAGVVMVTGGRQAGDRVTEARASADYLAGRGIPQAKILREVQGRSSWDSLAAAAYELRRRDLERVILVSDPFHSARIGAMADELELDAVVSPTRSSPISGASEVTYLAREAAAVGVGRVIGFRRLVGIDRAVVRARAGAESR